MPSIFFLKVSALRDLVPLSTSLGQTGGAFEAHEGISGISVTPQLSQEG